MDTPGHKRALSDASQPRVPHPTVRQPLAFAQDSLPSTQSLLQQLNLENIGPAARPPLEDQLAGIANPALANLDTRTVLTARIEKLTPATLRALLLDAAAAHWTVADQVDLEYHKTLRREQAARAEEARVRAAESASFERFLGESWHWLTKYHDADWHKTYYKAPTVEKNLTRMFTFMVEAIGAPDATFGAKASALWTMAGIYDNIFTNDCSEIAKIIVEDAEQYGPHLPRALDLCSPAELVRMRTDARADGKLWVDYAREVKEHAGEYQSGLEQTLQTALDRVEGAGTGHQGR